MGISSQAISVKSSINLSDINIDTDLNMGANSVIGYAKTIDIPKIRDLSSTVDSLYKINNHNNLNLPSQVVAGGTGIGTYTTNIYNNIVSTTDTLNYLIVNFNLKHSVTHTCTKSMTFYVDDVLKKTTTLSPTTSYVATKNIYTDISVTANKNLKIDLVLSTSYAGTNYVYVKDVLVDLYTATTML